MYDIATSVAILKKALAKKKQTLFPDTLMVLGSGWNKILEKLEPTFEISYEELFDKENILSSLAFETPIQTELVKGWRILSKTSLPEQDIASIIKESGSLGRALYSGAGFYRNVLGDEKAKAFKEEIENFKLNM